MARSRAASDEVIVAKVESETQARQGAKGKPVLYVLIGGVLLAVIAAVGALTWQNETSPPDRSSQSQEAARGTATGSGQPSNSSAGGTGGNPSNPSPAKQGAQ